jgi:signal transduction histidine kinase
MKEISGIIKKKISGSISGLFRGRKNNESDYLKKRITLLEKLLDEKTDCVERAKSIFLKNLYHEIRTPLNAILGFSDLIEMNSISIKEKEDYITHIRESSRDFLRKMDNIIEASIIEAGLLKLSTDECKLYDLMNEIHSYYSIQKHITERKIAFLLSVPDEYKDLVIQCDSYRLTQVLSNLISNSFKFTPQGIVEFGYYIQENEIEFFVKDSGIGGLEGKEKVVYKNFSKLDESDNSKEGLGLGLSLSKKLVELMSGKIWYKSIRTKGTIFYFTIPLLPVPRTKIISKADPVVESFNLKRSHRRSVVF